MRHGEKRRDGRAPRPAANAFVTAATFAVMTSALALSFAAAAFAGPSTGTTAVKNALPPSVRPSPSPSPSPSAGAGATYSLLTPTLVIAPASLLTQPLVIAPAEIKTSSLVIAPTEIKTGALVIAPLTIKTSPLLIGTPKGTP